jgi:hypothetical protein
MKLKLLASIVLIHIMNLCQGQQLNTISSAYSYMQCAYFAGGFHGASISYQRNFYKRFSLITGVDYNGDKWIENKSSDYAYTVSHSFLSIPLRAGYQIPFCNKLSLMFSLGARYNWEYNSSDGGTSDVVTKLFSYSGSSSLSYYLSDKIGVYYEFEYSELYHPLYEATIDNTYHRIGIKFKWGMK